VDCAGEGAGERGGYAAPSAAGGLRAWRAGFGLVGLLAPIGILARKPLDPLALSGVLVAALGLLIALRQPGNLR
jgi:hypothetical protein